MDKHTKELIRIYNIDGMKNIEIAAALGISERTVYRYLAIIRKEPKISYGYLGVDFSDVMKVIRELEEKQTKIMSPIYKDWNMFYITLEKRIEYRYCDGTLKQSRIILKDYFPEVDVEKSLEYFRSHGGYCDCEVLMNVEDSSDNIKKEDS